MAKQLCRCCEKCLDGHATRTASESIYRHGRPFGGCPLPMKHSEELFISPVWWTFGKIEWRMPSGYSAWSKKLPNGKQTLQDQHWFIHRFFVDSIGGSPSRIQIWQHWSHLGAAPAVSWALSGPRDAHGVAGAEHSSAGFLPGAAGGHRWQGEVPHGLLVLLMSYMYTYMCSMLGWLVSVGWLFMLTTWMFRWMLSGKSPNIGCWLMSWKPTCSVGCPACFPSSYILIRDISTSYHIWWQ